MHDFAQRRINRLLEWLLPNDIAEALVGDLLEEHSLRVRAAGSREAALWYWGQVFRSVAPVLHTAFRRGNWVPAWVVGFVAYSFAVSGEVSARVSVAKVATHTAVDAVPVLVVYLFFIALAGYICARVRRGAHVALTILVTMTAAVDLATAAHGMPLWYRLVLLVAAPATAVAGGALHALRARAAARGRSTIA